ncbi:hypothetical protein [Aeromonas caviae]|uniref:hypothetical protein n=1 Tax=Aeromonas caviae TaxID=648 RepID=UPI002B49E919|nr:hypothetical protein [Aeromonas caviae]
MIFPIHFGDGVKFMTDDKDLERQYRKNLMVVASLVLMYSIAGGQMTSDLSMFGAKLTFSRPEWLEYGMVFLMCFFWWRHWQVSKFTRATIKDTALHNVVLPSYVYERIKIKLCEKFGCDQDKYVVGPSIYGTEIAEANSPFSDSGIIFHLTGVGFISVRFTGGSEVFCFKLDFTWLIASFHYRKTWVYNAIHQTQFGDAMLPTITATIAISAYILQKIN